MGRGAAGKASEAAPGSRQQGAAPCCSPAVATCSAWLRLPDAPALRLAPPPPPSFPAAHPTWLRCCRWCPALGSCARARPACRARRPHQTRQRRIRLQAQFGVGTVRSAVGSRPHTAAQDHQHGTSSVHATATAPRSCCTTSRCSSAPAAAPCPTCRLPPGAKGSAAKGRQAAGLAKARRA